MNEQAQLPEVSFAEKMAKFAASSQAYQNMNSALMLVGLAACRFEADPCPHHFTWMQTAVDEYRAAQAEWETATAEFQEVAR
ncbi:MAG TPA: hypothetical protein VFC39_21855 [Acidobacteriaceae bacterium]|nr:hypothetical protein [Acidobacteriaceae bacterium]